MSDNDKKIGLGTQILSEGRDDCQDRLKLYEKQIKDALNSKNSADRLELIRVFINVKHDNPLSQAIADLLKPILKIDFNDPKNNKGAVAQAMRLRNWDYRGAKLKAAALWAEMLHREGISIEAARNEATSLFNENKPDTSVTFEGVKKAHQRYKGKREGDNKGQ